MLFEKKLIDGTNFVRQNQEPRAMRSAEYFLLRRSVNYHPPSAIADLHFYEIAASMWRPAAAFMEYPPVAHGVRMGDMGSPHLRYLFPVSFRETLIWRMRPWHLIKVLSKIGIYGEGFIEPRFHIFMGAAV